MKVDNKLIRSGLKKTSTLDDTLNGLEIKLKKIATIYIKDELKLRYSFQNLIDVQNSDKDMGKR